MNRGFGLVLYMRVSGKFPYFYSFIKKFYTQKSIKSKQATFRFFMHIKSRKSIASIKIIKNIKTTFAHIFYATKKYKK